MNLFIVPSWYPSGSNPSYGIFVKEQIAMMANERPSWKIGVSTWGQGDESKLIWVKDHLNNLKKIVNHGSDIAKTVDSNGFKEYYQPALSWTKKFKKGNIREIIRSNELNYQVFALENGKPDLIMVQACYPGVLIADYLSEKYKIPTHLHIRLGGKMFENMLSELGQMRTKMLSAISRANLITVTSKFHQVEINKWVAKSSILYNPVDRDFFKIDKSLKGDYAVAIGRLEDEKGFDRLIDALVLVPDLNLKIVGKGSLERKLIRKVEKFNLSSRVNFYGESNRTDVRRFIQNSKFLILPSSYETFGNVILEAMACGKPVVATKCGGPQEIVNADIGYLAEMDTEDLAQKIQLMVDSLNQFDTDQIRKDSERFSSQAWINSLEKLIITL